MDYTKNFETLGELVAYLQAHCTFKYDIETQHVFVIDKSNPTRNRSREFGVIETKNGFCLKEC